ncbi:methyl-accepting chemotaxis protein [Tropicibacter sp. S64]|uniref:methyl-accepting chemotaxis protein n=1 Tax=Tropicibacter sp. S64 TaxID=3415122 RepID=UPI003C7EAEBB
MRLFGTKTNTQLKLASGEPVTQGSVALIDMVLQTQAVIWFQTDGTIIDANKNFLGAVGYAREEIVGNNHSMFVTSDYRKSKEYAAFWESLRAGEVFTDRFARVRKDGSLLWLLATYAPVRDAQGQINGVVKIATDVTPRQKAIETIAAGLEHLRNGNLGHRVASSREPDLNAICEAFNAAASQLEELVDGVKSASARISESGSKIGTASEALSTRTETQAATLEETAAAVEELTSNAATAAENARNVTDIAVETQEAAKKGGQVVDDVIAAMTRISKSSGEISQIITVIEDLAFQTNLLSLNAGVEAARAGNAGRGFAVVASEVRALAQRSADSARDIKSLITESSEHVAGGVDLVQRANTELSTIFDRVGTITNNIKEIAGGLKEQSATLTEINTAVAELDVVTQRNAAMVLENMTISKTLSSDTEALFDQVAVFQTSQGKMHAGGWTHARPEHSQAGMLAETF